jgi:hypothetical protein
MAYQNQVFGKSAYSVDWGEKLPNNRMNTDKNGVHVYVIVEKKHCMSGRKKTLSFGKTRRNIMTTEQITNGLRSVGACWHRSVRKFQGKYEILPDASLPYAYTIERFSSLRKIAIWIKFRKEILKASAEDDYTKVAKLMDLYSCSR